MFSDSESAITMSMKYYEEQQKKAEAIAQKTKPVEGEDTDPEDDV